MLIKIVILLLFIGMVVSLFTGLVFMVKDEGTRSRQRTALGFRLFFATALIITLVYGFKTEQLQFGARWDAYKYGDPPPAGPKTTPSQ